MKLFEINEAIERCVLDGDNVVDTETGEVLDVEALNALHMAFDEKAETLQCSSGIWMPKPPH